MINDPLRLPIAFGPTLTGLGSAEQSEDFSAPAMPGVTNDSVRRMVPPEGPAFSSPETPFSGLGGIVAQLFGILAELMQAFGLPGWGGGGNSQTYFQNASGSSTGDPHLSFNGTCANGQSVSTVCTSMTGHDDLLNSDSFNGGYRVATSVTTPDAHGVTYNRSATVSLDYGSTNITLDAGGDATLTRNSQTTAIGNGQSVDLGNGESVTRGSDGSLTIAARNEQGALLTTKLTPNGRGVDVNTQAQNADIGGDLVRALTAR